MGEPRGDVDFPQEPLGAQRGSQLRMEHLDRDVAVVLRFGGEIYGRHAAPSELALDAVAAGKCGGGVGASGRPRAVEYGRAQAGAGGRSRAGGASGPSPRRWKRARGGPPSGPRGRTTSLA